MFAISIQDISKNYKQVEALKKVSLEIREGEFFGLLGPNGAGKTTLIKTIVGLARPTSGSITVFGDEVQKDYLKTKQRIGYSPQEANIDRYFSVRRILEFQGGYFGFSRSDRKQKAEELMERFDLAEKSETEFWKLSGGMQRRVLVSRSLMTNPDILILDEPTAGVDVEQRYELWELLRGLNKDRTTIVLTTHYIDEAETLCERVGIIDDGRIVEIGSPADLTKRHCERYFLVGQEKRRDFGGFDVDQVEVHRGSLEEVFLKLTGKSIHTDERKASL